jgi:plasmid maintenance system antidote protein VapI
MNEHHPDVVSPPGETLRAILKTRKMTQLDLSHRAHCSLYIISNIIRGKRAITNEDAAILERALGARAAFWLKRERDYREYFARGK